MSPADSIEPIVILGRAERDAEAIASLLRQRGWVAKVCSDVALLTAEIERIGALLVTDERLDPGEEEALLDALGAQPAWSELPILVLIKGREPEVERLLDSIVAAAGSVTRLDHPFRSASLFRAIEVAIRSRRRQYQVRDLLAKQDSIQRQLRDSEQRYRAFIAQSSEGIWRLEFIPPLDTRLPVEKQIDLAYQTGRLLECNDAMARMYGWTKADELIGQGLEAMLPAGDPRARDFLRTVITSGYRVTEAESQERRADGQEVILANTMVGVVEHDHLVRMWGTQRNITERKRVEGALRTSERRYRTLIDSIDEGFCVVEMIFDEEGRPFDFRFIEVNAAFERQAGLTDAVGRTMRELKPDHEQYWFDIYGHVARTGQSVRFQNWARTLHRWFDVFAVRIEPSDTHKIALMFSDITARRQADETKARLAAIVEFSDDAIISKDTQGVITTWNRGAERLFGYAAAEAIGQSITMLIPPERFEEEATILDRIRQCQPIEHYETVRLRKDGSLVDVSLTVSPLTDPAGNIVGASKIARDITERKRVEASLRRRALEQAALFQLSDRMNRATSFEDLFNAALDALLKAVGCSRASVLLFNEAGVMQFVAWRGLSETYRRAVEGHSPWALDTQNPEPFCIEDVGTAAIPQDVRAAIRQEGIRALAFIPITSAGRLLGKFMAYQDRPYRFTDEEISLALIVARQLAFGVERKRSEEALFKSEQQVRQQFVELEAIYDETPLGLSTLDTQLRFQRVNERMAEINGLPSAEHLGKTVREVVPSLSEQAEQALRQVMATGSPARFEFKGETRSHPGVIRIWDERWYPLRDETGSVTGVGVVAEEITERKRWETALRESEDRFRTLVEQVKDYAIFRMDNSGRPTSWNEGVQRVFGFNEAEFIGQDVTQSLFVPEDLAAGVPERELREAAESGTADNNRWMRRKDGTRFYAAGATTGLRGEGGELIGFTKVVRDETAAKLTEDALAEARARLQEHAADLERTVAERTHDLRTTNEQLEAFVYSIAHDLRAPLRTMNGFSQLLREDYADQLVPDAQDLLRRIQTSSEFMDRLLMDLLAYGRTARAEMELESVEVRKVWEAAVFQCRSQIEQSSADVQAIEPLPLVRAHEPTLGQCLANLLSNALKFVAPGVIPRVRLSAEIREGRARLWVDDNGIGIPPGLQERAFRVFERLHGSRYIGTGIGLSIVRKGVERMGGQVGLESMPDQGSRFWIELPLAPGKPADSP
jgi:PAS domain S-box-containing protein